MLQSVSPHNEPWRSLKYLIIKFVSGIPSLTLSKINLLTKINSLLRFMTLKVKNLSLLFQRSRQKGQSPIWGSRKLQISSICFWAKVSKVGQNKCLFTIFQCHENKHRWRKIEKSQLRRFFHLLPKLRTYFYVCLIDGSARIFPTSYAATGNWTHISSVAPLLRDLNPRRFIDWAAAAAAGSSTC